jgi:hypothetical protein
MELKKKMLNQASHMDNMFEKFRSILQPKQVANFLLWLEKVFTNLLKSDEKQEGIECVSTLEDQKDSYQ